MERVPGPFALGISDQLLPGESLEVLRSLFHTPQSWVRHQDSFYRCDMADVVDFDATLLDELRLRVQTVLELPLLDQVTVTAQRMHPGDGSDRHTDRPAAGFEAARLVVQLDAAEGGRFRAFDGERIWVDRAPRPNQAVSFELSARSHHDVTACRSERRTVVFHFWHPANPPDAGQRLDEWFGGMSFADLPVELDPAMARAESELPEELTFRAASIVWSLARLQAPDLVEAYRGALKRTPATDLHARIAWLVDLHLHGFDRVAGERLKPVRLPGALAPWSA